MAFLWALPYLVGTLLVHGLATRLPRGNPIGKFLLVGGAGGLALACHLLQTSGLTLATAAGLMAYAFACELYLFAFTLVASSVSARLLLLLREGELSRAQIQGMYDTAGMVERRLARLVAAGLLVRHGSAYRVTPKGRRLLGVFLALKGFFRHGQEPPLRKAA
jgi:DNA-binding HxlR family transcriptional regulator